ncbi:MAG: response regulator [Pseudomonadota bacterium]
MSALIIDDDPFSSKLTKGMLNKLGFEPIWEAGSGEEGLLAACSHHPDIILLDWIMPGMSGLETLRQLKSEVASSRSIPIVVTSESASRDAIVQTAREGASAVVLKPFATATLGARIVRALTNDAPAQSSDRPSAGSQPNRRQNRA